METRSSAKRVKSAGRVFNYELGVMPYTPSKMATHYADTGKFI